MRSKAILSKLAMPFSNNASIALVCYFKQAGIQPGDRIALVIDNSIDYVVAFYAVWKVGAIVVSLNPQAKFHEIEKLIHQSGAKCLLIDKLPPANIESLDQLGIQLITIKNSEVEGITDWISVLASEADNDWYPAQENTLAQIIYTSGTTGNPKGVLLSHGNLMCNIKDIIDYLKLTEQDSVLNVLPFHYCYGNSVLHSHLFCWWKSNFGWLYGISSGNCEHHETI